MHTYPGKEGVQISSFLATVAGKALNKFYKLEENASISLQEMENYFSKFSRAIPFILRLFFFALW